MTVPTPLTLDALAWQAATSPDDSWLPALVALAQRQLPGQPPVALLRHEGDGWTVLVASDPAPALPASPTEAEGALALPGTTATVLWVEGGVTESALGEGLRGALAMAGLALARREGEQERARQRAARDHFFSMVNHDLKSPLASIKAMADLVARKLARGTLDPATEAGRGELGERLGFLGERVRDMAALIDEIGDVSYIERGRLHLTLRRTDLRSAAHTATERIQAETGRTITVEGEAGPLPVQGDAQRLAQLFHILLKNAALYSEPQTPITVRLAAAQGRAEAEIRDEGPGILPELQARLFREYGRAVQRTPTSGLGIGLYVAAALATAHAGTLTLDSVPDAGTTARLSLPLWQEGAPETLP